MVVVVVVREGSVHLERNKESLLLLLLPGLSLQADTVPSTAADEDEDSRFPEEAAPLLVASLLAACQVQAHAPRQPQPRAWRAN